MATVSFYPIDVDYVTTSTGKTAIRIFGRTKKGKRVCVYDERFKPYFWVLPSLAADLVKLQREIAGVRVRKEKDVAYVASVSVEERRYLGKAKTMLQIFANAPSSVPLLKEEIQELRGVEACLEADIHFYRRYLIDTDLSPLELVTVEGEVIDEPVDAEIILNATSMSHDATDFLEHPRILAFDIEVASKIRVPDAKTDPIVMISFYGEDYQKVICSPNFKNPPSYVEFAENEAELLIRFKEIVKEYDPDYLAGYFSDGFDFPYIRARAQKYRINLDLGKDGSTVKFSRGTDAGMVKIVGIAHVDIYKFLRRVMIARLGISSLDLHSVATHLIGEGKVKSVDIGGLYEAIESKERLLAPFCEYNLQDSRVTYKVTMAMLPHLHEFVKLVGLPVDDVCRMSYGRLVESYLLRQIRQFKEVAPNRPSGREMTKRDYESYVGAFVHEPVAGLHKDLVVFDFKSLYPSIITAHNICVSTLTEDRKHGKPSPSIQVGKKEVQYYFDYTHDGFIPLILREILMRRSRIKEIMKKEGKKTDPILDARQYSLKTLANSFYGYFGFSGARWYSNECAAAITAYGRYYIKDAIEKAKKAGFAVVYGDTDSLFLSLGKKTLNDAQDFLAEINTELPSLMELEFEGYYPRGLFVMKKGEEKGAKKKYALIDEKGKIKVTGFETIRGDWSVLAKEVQKRVIELILAEQDVKKAVLYVQGIIKDTRDGKIPLQKMVIHKQLRKDIADYESIGPHVEVAKVMAKKGYQIRSGMMIAYVIDKGEGKLRDKARLIEDAQGYDDDYYIDNQILPAVGKIFEALGYSEREIAPKEQKELGDFS